MKLEAIIICKDYSDFLAHTLPHNIQQFDDVIVVTHPDDRATQDLCNYYSVETVKTTDFHYGGHKFNKGRGINLGLNYLQHQDWILHLDADILLPHWFRNTLDRARLREENIYGADRFNICGFEDFEKAQAKLAPHYNSRWFIDPPKGTRFGARVLHMQYGWTPIGYFQLWHSSSSKQYHYKQGSAEHADLLFGVQWPRENRILLPEVAVYHLESSADTPMGINWNGRKSPAFCPCHDSFLPKDLKYGSAQKKN